MSRRKRSKLPKEGDRRGEEEELDIMCGLELQRKSRLIGSKVLWGRKQASSQHPMGRFTMSIPSKLVKPEALADSAVVEDLAEAVEEAVVTSPAWR
jgi:hypothetical protein